MSASCLINYLAIIIVFVLTVSKLIAYLIEKRSWPPPADTRHNLRNPFNK